MKLLKISETKFKTRKKSEKISINKFVLIGSLTVPSAKEVKNILDFKVDLIE